MKNKIKKNDEVIVITGKDKGKIGKVKKIIPSIRKAIVEKINLIKKHQKPLPNINQPSGIFEKESKIDISNIAIFNKETRKADRIGFTFEKGKKIRFLKSNKKKLKK